jgi:hypothetical protein
MPLASAKLDASIGEEAPRPWSHVAARSFFFRGFSEIKQVGAALGVGILGAFSSWQWR